MGQTKIRHLDLLSRAGVKLTSSGDFKKKLNDTLALIGKGMGVSRAYIFIDNPAGTETSNEFEWCDDRITPQTKKFQNVPYSTIPSWRKLLNKKGFIVSGNISLLPKDLYHWFKRRGAVSPVVYPLIVNKEISGFVGLDECAFARKWEKPDLDFLEVIARMLANAYGLNKHLESIKASEKNSRAYFEAVDDIIVVADFSGKLLYSNGAARRKLGYSCAEMLKMHVLDMHPENSRKEAEKILTAMFKKELTHCPLELGCKNGKVLPVETRIWFGEWDGKKCIFGLSKDLSAEQEAFQTFQKVFEHNPEPMAITEIKNNTFIDVNSAFLKKLGYTRKEVIGKNAKELNLFPEQKRQAALSEKLAKTGGLANSALAVRRKDGKQLSGIFSGEIIKSQGKSFFLTVMVDVTEQEFLRKAIETQKEELKDIIEGGRIGTWVWNVQTGETLFNERWAEILGYSLKELQPVSIKTWKSLCHPEDFIMSEKLIMEHFEGKSHFYEFETRMRHKEGRWVWIMDRGRVNARDDAGKPLIMSGTHIDVSERRAIAALETELKLKEKDADFVKLSTNLPGVLFQLTRSADGGYSVPAATAGFQEMYGCASSEVAADFSPLNKTIQADDLAVLAAKVELSARKLLSFSMEYRLDIPGEPQKWISTVATPEKLADGSVTWYSFATDVTVRRKEQELLNSGERLKTVSILAGGIAHDFNNLLAGMFGNLELAKLKLKDNPGAVQAFDTVLDSFGRAKDLVQQLLFFTKGKGLNKQSIGLGPLLKKNASFVLAGSNVQCEFEIANDLPICEIDENQIGQVIDNIAINARQAMPSGGILTIRAYRRKFQGKELPELHPRGAYAVVEIIDRGVGMSGEVRKRILEPFFTTKKDGTGLGLPSANAIVQQHAGFMTVESVEGKGTTVRIALPESKKLANTTAVVESRDPTRAARILVMDDEVLLLRIIKTMLEAKGHTVITAENGEEALSCCRGALSGGERFDLAVMDITVPGGVGAREALKELRKFDRETPVICSSGYFLAGMVEELKAEGFAGILPKPYSMVELTNIIAKYV